MTAPEHVDVLGRIDRMVSIDPAWSQGHPPHTVHARTAPLSRLVVQRLSTYRHGLITAVFNAVGGDIGLAANALHYTRAWTLQLLTPPEPGYDPHDLFDAIHLDPSHLTTAYADTVGRIHELSGLMAPARSWAWWYRYTLLLDAIAQADDRDAAITRMARQVPYSRPTLSRLVP